MVTAATKRVLAQAASLSNDEILELISELSDRLEPANTPLSQQWKEEIGDRITELERGDVLPVPQHDVEQRIRQTIARLK